MLCHIRFQFFYFFLQCCDLILDRLVLFLLLIGEFEFVLTVFHIFEIYTGLSFYPHRIFFPGSFCTAAVFLLQPHLIIREAALVLSDRAVLKCKDPSHHPIQKIAVMGNGDHNAVEMVEIVFQDRECLYIQIIGGLIEDQHIGRLHQHTQQVQPASLPARKLAEQPVLLLRRKQKPLEHDGRRDRTVHRLHILCGVPNIIYDAHVRSHVRQTCALVVFDLLRVVPDPDRLPCDHLSRIRLLHAAEHSHERRFSTAVFPDKTDPVIFQENITEIVDQGLSVIAFCDISKLHRRPAHAGGNAAQLELRILLRSALRRETLIALYMCLLLGAPGARASLHPLDLHAQDALPFPLCGKFHVLALRLQLQETCVVCLVAVGLPLVDLHDPVRHTVEKIPVVRHHDQGSPKIFQIFLEPVCHGGIQMVGRLVKHQHIRF